ncbi:hypothetical protein IBA8401_39870 [Pseudomonas syringae]
MNYPAERATTSRRICFSLTTRKPRDLEVYKNPNTGEVIETKGGNHKALKQWNAEYGADVVEGWQKK